LQRYALSIKKSSYHFTISLKNQVCDFVPRCVSNIVCVFVWVKIKIAVTLLVTAIFLGLLAEREGKNNSRS
ncbi:hypothetical protein, partial [uncultured Duncaniella sp.]|uniref:hypothetical protein n=1 Tax=uncultured Duncaniella sp. TaxID=2768039 RepID=UPI00261FF12F